MSQLLTPEQLANFPVAHFSNTSIRQYLTNRQSFFKKYIRMEFDETWSPAMIEWNLWHSVLQDYYEELKETWKRANIEDLLEKNIQQYDLDNKREQVNRWKNGSKESSINTVRQALEFYANEIPQFQNIYAIEARILSDFEDLEGSEMPIPLKWFLDLIVSGVEDWNEFFDIEDHKFVTTIVQQEESCPKYEIQAAQYWFLSRKHLWINPRRMVFRQIKKTKNSCPLNAEELEALLIENWIPCEIKAEKTQLLEICIRNGISSIVIPEKEVNVEDLNVTELKMMLENEWIEFKKSAPKKDLVALCHSNWQPTIIIAEHSVWIETLKIDDIKAELDSRLVSFNLFSKKDQLVTLWIEAWLVKIPPQVVPYVVEYTVPMLERFLEIYRRIVKELSWQPLIDPVTWIAQFLPNPYEQFWREQSRNDFCDEVEWSVSWNLNDIVSSVRWNKFEDSMFEAVDLD